MAQCQKDVKQASRELREGYLPIGCIILDGMRCLLNKIASALAAAGIPTLAVTTDAAYIAGADAAAARTALTRAGFRFGGIDWLRVGALRVKMDDAIRHLNILGGCHSKYDRSASSDRNPCASERRQPAATSHHLPRR